MKQKWMYIIYFRDADGEILRYVTNDSRLYRQELDRLRGSGKEILRTHQYKI